MKKLFFSVLFIICSAANTFAQTSQTVSNGFSVERELGETETHIYEITLTKQQMLNFTVEQRGIDVRLRITTADGKFVDRVDSPNGREGDEPFKMVSLDGGRYRIEVSRLWDDALSSTGKYLVKPVTIRPATNAEIKTARLKEELLKIIAEDNRPESYTDALRRFYLDKALQTNAFGSVANAAELIELTAKIPFKPKEGYSDSAEYSGVLLEEFGDILVLSVRRDLRAKNLKTDEEYTIAQQIGYVFKRANDEWRVINRQNTFTEPDRKIVKFDVKLLDSLIGVYQGGKASEMLTITREGNTLFGKLGTDGEKIELFPESDKIFYGFVFSVAFVRDANGAVTQAVTHLFAQNRMTIQPKIK